MGGLILCSLYHVSGIAENGPTIEIEICVKKNNKIDKEVPVRSVLLYFLTCLALLLDTNFMFYFDYLYQINKV